MHSGTRPLTCSCKKGVGGGGGGSLNDFKSGTSIGAFSSDDAANTAVKRLMTYGDDDDDDDDDNKNLKKSYKALFFNQS